MYKLINIVDPSAWKIPARKFHGNWLELSNYKARNKQVRFKKNQNQEQRSPVNWFRGAIENINFPPPRGKTTNKPRVIRFEGNFAYLFEEGILLDPEIQVPIPPISNIQFSGERGEGERPTRTGGTPFIEDH